MRLNKQKGEIATTLTLIALGIMAVGTMLGTIASKQGWRFPFAVGTSKYNLDYSSPAFDGDKTFTFTINDLCRRATANSGNEEIRLYIRGGSNSSQIATINNSSPSAWRSIYGYTDFTGSGPCASDHGEGIETITVVMKDSWKNQCPSAGIEYRVTINGGRDAEGEIHLELRNQADCPGGQITPTPTPTITTTPTITPTPTPTPVECPTTDDSPLPDCEDNLINKKPEITDFVYLTEGNDQNKFLIKWEAPTNTSDQVSHYRLSIRDITAGDTWIGQPPDVIKIDKGLRQYLSGTLPESRRGHEFTVLMRAIYKDDQDCACRSTTDERGPISTPGPTAPPQPPGGQTRQVDWVNPSTGTGLCWVAWADGSCSLRSHEGGGVGNFTCSQGNGNDHNTTITSNAPNPVEVSCDKYLCNACSGTPTNHAQCQDGSPGNPQRTVFGTRTLNPGCSATCGEDGIIGDVSCPDTQPQPTNTPVPGQPTTTPRPTTPPGAPTSTPVPTLTPTPIWPTTPPPLTPTPIWPAKGTVSGTLTIKNPGNQARFRYLDVYIYQSANTSKNWRQRITAPIDIYADPTGLKNQHPFNVTNIDVPNANEKFIFRVIIGRELIGEMWKDVKTFSFYSNNSTRFLYPIITVTGSGIQSIIVNSLSGDLNNDSIVNTLDYSLLIQKYAVRGEQLSEDLNADGIVNALDLSLLIRSLGQKVE